MRLRLVPELWQTLDDRHEQIEYARSEALTTLDGLGILIELAKISEVIVGAGTVLDADTATTAIRMGASFLLSPSVVIRVGSRYGAVSVPGAFTATEVLIALEAGANIVKIFPASTGGLSHIESIGAPLPRASLMPSGGVSVDDVRRRFVKKVAAVGVGGALTSGAKPVTSHPLNREPVNSLRWRKEWDQSPLIDISRASTRLKRTRSIDFDRYKLINASVAARTERINHKQSSLQSP